MNSVACSIIITSYNASRFIADTIESALAQDYPNLEVIVVDDGSKDDSLAVIGRYSDRLTLISKENGGQASAFNSGFARSRGSIVFFLDGDDTLLPDTVSRAVGIWHPAISKIHFRLQRMQQDGTPIPGSLLPPYRPLPSGDLTPMLRRFGFYPSPPTSGNAFSRAFLDRVMPMPENLYRSSADTFLIGLAPLFGNIGALGGIGGHWRLTGQNNSSGGLAVLEQMVQSEDVLVAAMQNVPNTSGVSRPYFARSPQGLKNKLLLRKFSLPRPPGRLDLFLLILSYVHTTMRWPGYDLATRIKFLGWAILMGLVPERILRRVPGIAGPAVKLSQPKPGLMAKPAPRSWLTQLIRST